MADLPFGWGDRHNTMSEHDMKLGGMAATKFGGTAKKTAKNSYENDADGSGGTSSIGYKNSDQVRQYYLNEFQKAGSADGIGDASSAGGKGNSNVPDFWADRQREREIQAKQMGVFSKDSSSTQQRGTIESKVDGRGDDDENGSFSAEVALVQIATHTLEKMASSLNGKGGIDVPMAERSAFAAAVKKAMDALAKQA